MSGIHNKDLEEGGSLRYSGGIEFPYLYRRGNLVIIMVFDCELSFYIFFLKVLKHAQKYQYQTLKCNVMYSLPDIDTGKIL